MSNAARRHYLFRGSCLHHLLRRLEPPGQCVPGLEPWNENGPANSIELKIVRPLVASRTMVETEKGRQKNNNKFFCLRFSSSKCDSTGRSTTGAME